MLFCFLLVFLTFAADARKMKVQGKRAKKRLEKIARKRSGDTTTKLPREQKIRNRLCQMKVMYPKYRIKGATSWKYQFSYDH